MPGSGQAPLEKWIGEVWADVIGTDPPRLSDTFSGIGGHSIHALRVVHRLREGLGIPVPLAVLFDAEDLADLCRWLREEIARLGVSSPVPGSGFGGASR